MYIHIHTWDHYFRENIQPVTMIANGEINKNGIIFFEYLLVGPDQLPHVMQEKMTNYKLITNL